ncbi:MAG: hypothetical protein V4857_19565 [Pseudomonadota bacterium]
MSFLKLISASLGLLLTTTVSAGEVAYQPFPKGYGYLEPGEVLALKAAVKKGDNAVVREHGWRLWAGIMQPAAGMDWPVWYTWPNGTDAFAGKAALLAGTAAATMPPKRHMGRLGGGTLNPVMVANIPLYPIPAQVIKAYPAATDPKKCNNVVCDGIHFAFNGDIMIATESLSKEALDFIRDPKQPVYKKSTLDTLYSKADPSKRVHNLDAPPSYVVTKHMYWPVKAKGLTALPVWHDDFDAKYQDYAGYEKWKTVAAIDPSGKQVGKSAQVSYLHGVTTSEGKPWPTITKRAKVVGLQDFYHHRVTQADWDSFDEADKAIINAASYWLSNQPFGVGDYLVTVAMHINTKEIPSWGLQSVWWSDLPDSTPYAANRPAGLTAKGPWKHYLLTEAYGIPEKGNPKQVPVATNPYIELVSHPVATNCYNCHVRAGWPNKITPLSPVVTSYQNPDCPDLRAALTTKSKCLAPFTLTDFQWIIPDRAISD